MTDMLADVRAFHERFNIRPRMALPTPVHALPSSAGAQRVGHLVEELKEFMEAVRAGDLTGQADALADLVYVALGTAIMMGVPWNAVWDEVHAANMRKAVGLEPEKQGIVKPAGWVGPDVAGAIARAGRSK